MKNIRKKHAREGRHKKGEPPHNTRVEEGKKSPRRENTDKAFSKTRKGPKTPRNPMASTNSGKRGI